jgi:hypothetical protein
MSEDLKSEVPEESGFMFQVKRKRHEIIHVEIITLQIVAKTTLP